MLRFTYPYSLKDGESGYLLLLREIRRRLGDGLKIHNVPILVRERHAPEPLEFFDIELTDMDRKFSIQARFRTDNLYMVGWRPGDSNDWYELRSDLLLLILVPDNREDTRL